MRCRNGCPRGTWRRYGGGRGLDLGDLERAYAGKGSAAYHPALLLSLLIYGYATGCFSSRKIEQATYDSLAFRYIVCNRHPDHDTLANFRKRFGKEFEAVFVEAQVARENQLSRFGHVSLDGTKTTPTPAVTAPCPMGTPRPSRRTSRLRFKNSWRWLRRLTVPMSPTG